jgi:hypothetical protein
MPKIKLLKNTMCGGVRVDAGDVVDASDKDAKILMDMKAATLVEEKKKTGRVQNRDQVSLKTPEAAMTTKSAKGLK